LAPDPDPFWTSVTTIAATPDEFADLCPASLQLTIAITANGHSTAQMPFLL
jgi:hypothetical protein